MAPKAKAKAAAKKTEPRTVKEPPVDIVKVFRNWDTTGDGRISVEELTAVLVKIGIAEGDIPAVFESADLNKDGFLNYDEFMAWLGDTAPSAVQQFAKEAKIPPKDEVDGQKRLDDLLSEVFKCFDQDQDGQIERVEMLDVTEKIYKEMDETFNVKSRKECMAWFKEAGAEGTPTDGMYLSPEKWRIAYLAQLQIKAGCTVGEPSILADYLYRNIAEQLFKITYPPSTKSVAGGASPAAEATAEIPPSWPIVIDFKDLQSAMNTAQKFERSILILSSGKEEVETFFAYKNMKVLDCKQMINEIFVKKNFTKEHWQTKASELLVSAMNSDGFCKPIHMRMSNSAFDWVNFCHAGFPADVFSPSVWTPSEALKSGLMDDGHKFNVEVDDFKKWKDFQIVVTSMFDLNSANEHLPKMLPHWDEFAIIVIDPKSISEG